MSMQCDTARPLFTWRSAIVSSDMPSTARHVLITLSLWMNEMGRSCYPTTLQMAEATGLSERSICTHLAWAEQTGWIIRRLHGFAGQKWKNYEYEPVIPASFWEKKALKEIQQLNKKGTEGDSAAFCEGTEPDDTKALKEVQCNTPSNTPVKKEPPVSPFDKGEQKIASQEIQTPKTETPTPNFVQTRKMTFVDFLKACSEHGEKAIPSDDPAVMFAERVNLPDEFMQLAWATFKTTHLNSPRLGGDWRARFRAVVEKMGGGLWRYENGVYLLTGRGEQAKMAHGA